MGYNSSLHLFLRAIADCQPGARSTRHGDARLIRDKFLWIALAVCVLSLALFFRQFLDSGFNLIAGDLGDNRLVIAMLEHWRAVTHGRAFFTSPNFYWPQIGVLGYSEAFFLDTLPYQVGRAAGLDVYTAFELTLIFLKAIGFFSMLWLLRSFIGVSRTVALVGSALFTISNLYFVTVNHSQLVAVVFVPLLLAFSCAAWRASREERTIPTYIYSASSGLLLALILYTSFYIGWFAVLAGGISIVSALVCYVFRRRTLLAFRRSVCPTALTGSALGTAALCFVIAIIPFIMTYAPALQQTGGRSFGECLLYSAQPIDVVNVGTSNLIWGRLLDKARIHLGYLPMTPSETETGWPPLTLATLAFGIILGFSRNGATSRKNKPCFLMVALGASFIIGWGVSVKFHDHSFWWVVFKMVPGGSGIRVPARFDLVLNILVVVVVCLVLDEFHKRSGRVWTSIFWALSLWLLVEQTNTAATHLIQRGSEDAILRRVKRPPSACASFFIVSPATPDRPGFANQVDAMLIARRYNIPTLNGYSGWSPPVWDISSFDNTYLRHVGDWARTQRVLTGLCGLDLHNGDWIPGVRKLMESPTGLR